LSTYFWISLRMKRPESSARSSQANTQEVTMPSKPTAARPPKNSSQFNYTKNNALTDTAVHDIDIARFLLDDEPAAISVMTPRRNSRGGDLADPLFTMMEMRGGALVTIETSVNIACAYDIRGEIIGETGVVTLAERNDVVVKSNGGFTGRVPADWRERFVTAFDTEFREWLAAAANGGAAGPSAWDGYVATVVSGVGVRAIESGEREPIELRERPALYAV
jgi:myo-inositol 2-dehydrogenase/D-chiro-inositol 1-dehydrogenase